MVFDQMVKYSIITNNVFEQQLCTSHFGVYLLTGLFYNIDENVLLRILVFMYFVYM